MSFINGIKSFPHVILSNLFYKYKRPLSMNFLITYKCPYSCEYCNITKNVFTEKELSKNEVFLLIDEMKKAGVIKLQLTGGEPFTREDISEIINYSVSKNIFTGVSTSGFGIENNIEAIKKLDLIQISIEGPEEIHDRIRGHGSFKQAVKALDLVSNLKKPKLWTTSVINRINYLHIEDILEITKKYGITSNFVMLHPRENDLTSCFSDRRTADNYILPYDILRDTVKKIINLKKSGKAIGTSFEYLNHLLELKNNYRPFSDNIKKSKCFAGRLYGFIEPDGTLFNCGTLREGIPGIKSSSLSFKESFNKLNPLDCSSCLSACQMEQNFIFNLKLSTILNWVKLIIK